MVFSQSDVSSNAIRRPMRKMTYIIGLLFLSCYTLTKDTSFWERKKKDFKYLNKKEFISDSTLRAEIKNFNTSRHPLFDSLLGDKVYLYSWQDRDKSKNEFTVVKDDGELGLKIFYFILDNEDNLISWKQIAGKGSEGIYWFETRTTIRNHDTLINIGAITQWYDPDKQMKMKNTKGDSTFSYLVIDSKGKITESIFREVKDINLENE
jgi:hypothetical protein